MSDSRCKFLLIFNFFCAFVKRNVGGLLLNLFSVIIKSLILIKIKTTGTFTLTINVNFVKKWIDLQKHWEVA